MDGIVSLQVHAFDKDVVRDDSIGVGVADLSNIVDRAAGTAPEELVRLHCPAGDQVPWKQHGPHGLVCGPLLQRTRHGELWCVQGGGVIGRDEGSLVRVVTVDCHFT